MTSRIGVRRPAAVFAAAIVLAGCGSSSTAIDELTRFPPGFDIQGHRGARGLKPENTLPSFEVALDAHASTLELDVHFSADGQIVVWHDPIIEPEKCGLAEAAPAGIPDPDNPGSSDERGIRRLSTSQLVWYRCDRNPDAGTYPNQDSESTELAGGDYRIVTLSEVFEFVSEYVTSTTKTDYQRANAASVRFNIETKRRGDAPWTIQDGFDGVEAGSFELALLEVIVRFGLEERVIIQSFDQRSLWAIGEVAPELRLAVLTSDDSIDLAAYAANGASIWSPRASTLDRSRLDDAHLLGMQVIPWTVNDPDDVIRLVGLGVDGIITDRPDLFDGR